MSAGLKSHFSIIITKFFYFAPKSGQVDLFFNFFLNVGKLILFLEVARGSLNLHVFQETHIVDI